MSDTTDRVPTGGIASSPSGITDGSLSAAGVVVSIQDASASVPAAVDSALYNHPRIAAHDLVRLVQGLYLIFWGLLVAALLGAQMVAQVWVRSPLNALMAAGVLATLVGTFRLQRARLDSSPVGGAWRARARGLMMLAVLMAYFCAFFYMWRRVPTNLYLMVNAIAFPAMAIIYMIAFNYAVAVVGSALGRKGLATESRVFGGCAIGLLFVPFVCAVLYVFPMAVRHKVAPWTEFEFLLSHVNLLVLAMILLPFSLTLSVAWAVKDAAMRQLMRMDTNNEPQASRPE